MSYNILHIFSLFVIILNLFKWFTILCLKYDIDTTIITITDKIRMDASHYLVRNFAIIFELMLLLDYLNCLN